MGESAHVKIGRRVFLRCAGSASVCTLAAGCAGLPFTGSESYSVAILGDTHFDAEPASVYHSKYDDSNPWSKVQRSEFRRNGEMWRFRCRDLLGASGMVARRRRTDFVLQLGDLIQGDCDDAQTHVKMLRDCINLFRSRYPAGIPLLTVAGNHDYRGKNARDAYFGFIEPYLFGELGVAVQYPAFSFRRGPDCWVFCNFESRDLKSIRMLIESAADARHVFLVTHGPFTASDTNSWKWRLGGSDECAEERKRLYETLSRRHAVVLSGHTHTVAWFRHENRFGSFCEFTANSVWADPLQASAVPIFSKPEDYGRRSEAKFKGEALADFRRDLDFFRPGLKGYFFSRGAGHFRLNVSDRSVKMEFYPGAAQRPEKSFEMI